MPYPQNQSRTAQGVQSAPRTSPKNNLVIAAAIVLSALILGICLIIASSVLGGKVKKLTEAVEKQNFTTSVPAFPSNFTVNNTAPKQYFTETEAAQYLNMTADDIRTAVKSGDIDEYISTDNGYVISKDKLDSYFETEAYNTRVRDNS